MNLFATILVLGLIGSAFAVPTTTLTTSSRLSIQQKIAANGGCRLNLCFALDGSGSISTKEYDLQKNFVNQVVAAIAGNPQELAAVQYGLVNCPISPLTDDIASFSLAVNRDVQKKAQVTFVAGGLVYCQRQLRKMDNDANKIIVIGDGLSNFGGDPVPLANLFRQTGGEVCSIGVRFPDTKVPLLINLAGGSDKVFTVQDYLGLFDIVEPLVLQMCGVPLS